MRILHIVPTYLPAYRYGGPIYSVHELNKWLVKNGAEVTVYTTNIDGPNDLDAPTNKPVTIDGVKIHYFKSSFPRSWFYSHDLRLALRDLRGFDVVHITSVFLSASYLGAKYAKKAGIPYIISPRGSLIPELIKKKSTIRKKLYINLIEKRNLIGASAIHFTTELEKEEYLKLGLPLKGAIVIPNGIEVHENIKPQEHENKFRKKFDISGNAKIILSLGRLNWKKGFDTIIPAFAEVAKQELGVVLVIAGSDSDEPGYKKKIESQITNHKSLITNKVIFTGDLRDDDKKAAYQSADIFVMPSYSENFGISAVEAMSASVPVIVTDSVGIASDIRGAKAGLVIKKDKTQLVKAILGLLRDHSLRIALGERGKKLVQEKYAWPEITRYWISEYEKIVTSNQ